MNTEPNEVTWKQLVDLVMNMVHSFIKLLSFTLSLIKARLLYFLIFILAGGLAGWLTSARPSSYFEGGMTCTYNELHKKVYGEMIDRLGQAIAIGDFPSIASELGMREEEAASIISISATNLLGAKLSEDLTLEKLPFYINYRLKTPEQAAPLNSALIKYLQNCEYNASRRKVRLQNAEKKVAYLSQQLEMIDSMKRSYTDYLQKGRQLNSEPVDLKPEELFKESEVLFNARQDAGWEMSIDNSVEVIYTRKPILNISPAKNLERAGLGAAAGFAIWFFAFGLYAASGRSGREQG